MRPLISFIIPTYNQAHTIGRAIESIYRELGSEKIKLEIVIIDDGSTDNLKEFIEEIPEDRDEITYYRTENRGPSAARNIGIHLASGRLLFFLDSDDELDELSLDCLAQIQAFNGNCAILDSDFRNAIAGQSRDIETVKISADRALQHLCTGELKQGIGLGKLFSREFVVRNELSFCENLTVGEDLIFIHSVLLRCETVSVIGHDCVIYAPSPQGLSLSLPPNNKLRVFEKKLYEIVWNEDTINRSELATLYLRIMIPYAIKFNVCQYDSRIFTMADKSSLNAADKRIAIIIKSFGASRLFGRTLFSLLRQAYLLKSSFAALLQNSDV